MRVYLDNNIYNYLVDGVTISSDDVNELVEAVKLGKVEILFSPTNLVEIVRCYENKDIKAQEMIEISYALSKRVAKMHCEIMIDELNAFASGDKLFRLNPFHATRSLDDEIREGMLKTEGYEVPEEFHEKVRGFDQWYVDSLRNAVAIVNEVIAENTLGVDTHFQSDAGNYRPLDLFERFNSDCVSRRLFIDAILKDRCGFKGDTSLISSFTNLPSLDIFLRFYSKIAYELLIKDKSPKSGDWADLAQTVHFHYVDIVVTSDTGKAGLFPNYREILSSILQPRRKSVVKFSTLLNKIRRFK